jgi:hypothetical protein
MVPLSDTAGIDTLKKARERADGEPNAADAFPLPGRA